ncbi:DoxX family protein [Thermoflavimicrobium daqui]|jgi:uncharacterized membrane protein YphA (DoxX/SURF4 family)|uniref:DoxX family protein n=1 Tax=Thermoflavimicrobium daqui TaxID=2137476 RepID=A0A364K498_9BACL|nr:DoxX family protein [Thermoflavimicrobium daqui]RAL24193.1 DoxX family protein [Thermoflavimicrobium daqui]
MKTFTLVIQILLAINFLSGGFVKLFRVPFQVEHWQAYQYPLWFMSVIGFIEIIGALGLVAGIWNRYIAISTCIILVFILIGAIYTHIFRANQAFVTIIPAMVCLILCIIVIIQKWRVEI